MLTHNKLEVLIMPFATETLVERFWGKGALNTDTNLCWHWKGYKRNGYGLFNFKGKTYSAHRIAYFLHYNKDPLNKQVCHKCEEKCCNPNHLFLGTNQENQQDLLNKKGKAIGFKGEQHTMSKLTDKIVYSIRKEYNSNNITQKELSKKYGIDKGYITEIIRGRRWAHTINENIKEPYWRQTRLTESKVNSIISDYANNSDMELKELAIKYNVKITAISNILNNKTWKHLNSVKCNIIKPRHNSQKLTESQVLSIIKEHSIGKMTNIELAKKYGVNNSNIGFIIKGKTWKHLHV